MSINHNILRSNLSLPNVYFSEITITSLYIIVIGIMFIYTFLNYYFKLSRYNLNYNIINIFITIN